MTYLQSNKSADCVFCQALQQPDSSSNLVVQRGKNAFVILNRYPYTSGHLMVVPNAHLDSLTELTVETRTEIFELAAAATQVLTAEFQPQGFNLGMNIGEAAGAGIADHVHMHIVPRWSGDTSFMSAVADTRVLPEALDVTYARINAAWRRLRP